MPTKLATVHHSISAGLSTPGQRTRWTDGLAGILPALGEDGIHSEETAELFLDVCTHLMEHAADRAQRKHLIQGLSDAQRRIPWADPLFLQIDEILSTVVDVLYDELADDLAGTEDPDTAVSLYEELCDNCVGLDKQILALAAACPHITGRRIMLDFADLVLETGADGLVEKLEAEEELEFLDMVVESNPAASYDLVKGLADPDRFVTDMLERRLARKEKLPDWIWYCDVLVERFDLLLTRISWHEVSERADGPIWARIETHLRRELADDQERWETFHALEADFAGTLEELVTAARHL